MAMRCLGMILLVQIVAVFSFNHSPVQLKTLRTASCRSHNGPMHKILPVVKAVEENQDSNIDWDAELKKLQTGQIDTTKVPKGIDGMNDLEITARKAKKKVQDKVAELPKIDIPLPELSEIPKPSIAAPKELFKRGPPSPKELYRKKSKPAFKLQIPPFYVLKEDWRFWAALIFGFSIISAVITVSQREELIVQNSAEILQYFALWNAILF